MKEHRHIIIVDDDPAIPDAVKIMLEHKGYTITIFDNSTALLEGNFQRPNLFIIDKQLQGVDGLEICRYLKSQQALKEIPVLILSANPYAGHLAKAVGADGFLEKPFKMKMLREMVERLMQ